LPIMNIDDTTMAEFTKVMKALSDPNRVKIIKMLQHKSLCVCELKAALEISQPTVSKHLKILQNAGIIISEKDGLWVNCSLTNGDKSPYVAALLGNLKHWLENDPQIESLHKKLLSINREEVCGR